MGFQAHQETGNFLEEEFPRISTMAGALDGYTTFPQC
jgi:hypothetical protein